MILNDETCINNVELDRRERPMFVKLKQGVDLMIKRFKYNDINLYMIIINIDTMT